MGLSWKSLADKEKDSMMSYADQIIEESDRKKMEAMPCRHWHKDINKSAWFYVEKSANEVWKVCNLCGEKKEFHWTNETLRYLEKHKADFAQPGSELWKKQYGNRTPEEVAAM